jgi:hypothetical protein
MRYPVLAVYALMLGAVAPIAGAQPPDPRARDRHGEPMQRPPVTFDPRRTVEGPTADPAVPPRVAPRPAWPGDLHERWRAGETAPWPYPPGAGEVQCWPHGDHFHCR